MSGNAEGGNGFHQCVQEKARMALFATYTAYRYQPVSWQIIHQSDGRFYRHLALISPSRSQAGSRRARAFIVPASLDMGTCTTTVLHQSWTSATGCHVNGLATTATINRLGHL